MTDLVVDSSALVAASVSSAATLARDRVEAGQCHAPHLVDAEVGSTLRRLVLAGRLTPAAASVQLRRMSGFVDYRYHHTGSLRTIAWELRDNLNYYDALYVALATVLDLPLLTADARLARAPGLTCQVELVS